MGKSIREVYGTVLAELGDTNENIVVLDADLSGSTKSGIFAKAHPERHFNMGIAESDMVATAAALTAACPTRSTARRTTPRRTSPSCAHCRT